MLFAAARDALGVAVPRGEDVLGRHAHRVPTCFLLETGQLSVKKAGAAEVVR